MRIVSILALCALFATSASADDEEDLAKAVKAAERRAKSFFLARKPKKIYRTVSRGVERTKQVKVSKKVREGGRWVRRRVTESRKTTVHLYSKEVNKKAVKKSWVGFLLPDVREGIDDDSLLKLVRIDLEQEYRLLKAIDDAARIRLRPMPGEQARDYQLEARRSLEAYLATCWPLALTKVKHLRTVCSRSSVTMWHRASEVRINTLRRTEDGSGSLVPVESENKRDKSLLRTLPAVEVMTVWVRLGGKFYLSAAVEDVPTRGGSAIVLRACEGEVLRPGPGMTADELVAQAYDGAAGEVELGEVSDTGFLQSLRPESGSTGVLAEVRVGVNTLWLRVKAEADVARLKKLRVNATVTFRGTGAITTNQGARTVVVREATLR